MNRTPRRVALMLDLQWPFKRNTVRQVITTDAAKVFLNGGRPRCDGRFFANFDIFRFTTRGFVRSRRGSIRSAAISCNSQRYHSSKLDGEEFTHSGSRACKIRRQPVNDNRSTSRSSVWADASIIARTTK